jgi:homoserine kinase type II
MSVFTSVSESEAASWLAQFSVGTLTELRGIAAGIENTNYFASTTNGRFVLTIFEKLTALELPYYLNLMSHLARHGIPCPAPIANNSNETLLELKGKPAALVTRLPGGVVSAPDARHCREVGETLANMHLAGRSYGGTLENPRGPRWWIETAPKVMPFLDAERQALLQSEIAYQSTNRSLDLPRGSIHADLFRDNVLFDGHRLGGVIDFYFAGVDALLFDVAVTLNDWCVFPDGTVDPPRATELLAGYHAKRPFTAAERAAWPTMIRAAALRFWLSRLYDFYLPRAGELVHAHDPEHFCRILRLRIDASGSLA